MLIWMNVDLLYFRKDHCTAQSLCMFFVFHWKNNYAVVYGNSLTYFTMCFFSLPGPASDNLKSNLKISIKLGKQTMALQVKVGVPLTC